MHAKPRKVQRLASSKRLGADMNAEHDRILITAAADVIGATRVCGNLGQSIRHERSWRGDALKRRQRIVLG